MNPKYSIKELCKRFKDRIKEIPEHLPTNVLLFYSSIPQFSKHDFNIKTMSIECIYVYMITHDKLRSS